MAADTEEYDVNDTGGSNKPRGYSMTQVLSRVDKKIANYPNTAVKYIHDDLNLVNLDWKKRADFEFYLLNYNVNRNADLATGADSLSTLLKTRDFKKALQFKRGYRDGFVAICSLILFIAIILFIIGLIMLLLCLFVKSLNAYYPIAQTFVINAVLVVVMLSIVIFLSNVITNRISTTESLAK